VSRLRDVRRRLDATVAAIEALDADLAAGKLDGEEHRRRRAEHEREGGRLLVSLRQAERGAGAARARQSAPAERWPSLLRNPTVIAAAGLLLLVGGVGAGLLGARWLGGPPAAAGPAAASGSGRSPLTGDIERRAVQLAAAREDAPIPTLLQIAHDSLDQGRLDEARDVYGRVLRREPRNAEAITHLGAVLYQEGRIDEALAKVEEALRIDPAYIHAHWDRTQYLFHGKRDYPATIRAGEAFLRVVPDGPDASSVRSLVAQARELGAKNPPSGPKAR
jgi:tetratricopeptide (TPR) repeat protein